MNFDNIIILSLNNSIKYKCILTNLQHIYHIPDRIQQRNWTNQLFIMGDQQ